MRLERPFQNRPGTVHFRFDLLRGEPSRLSSPDGLYAPLRIRTWIWHWVVRQRA